MTAQRNPTAVRRSSKAGPEDRRSHCPCGDRHLFGHRSRSLADARGDGALSLETTPPIKMPFFLEAAILSRMRSPVTSRSNWAKDSRTFRVSRPMLVVVLNAWVTETRTAAQRVVIRPRQDALAVRRIDRAQGPLLMPQRLADRRPLAASQSRSVPSEDHDRMRLPSGE